MKAKIILIIYILLILQGISSADTKTYKVISIDTNTYDLFSLFNIEKTATIWQDWIAIHTLKNGWGPHGGNIFMEISDSGFQIREIFHPWEKDRKLVFELKDNLPVVLGKNKYKYSYNILAYDNSKLWFSFYWYDLKSEFGDYFPPPRSLCYIDFNRNEVKSYLQNDFPDSYIPYIYRIVFQDNYTLLIGYKSFHFDDEGTLEAILKLQDCIVYLLDPKKNEFVSLEIK